MKYLQGQDREQLHIFPVTMEAAIGADNEVRMIELFMESLDMETLGFKVDHIDPESYREVARPTIPKICSS